jgi:hypothetical protein
MKPNPRSARILLTGPLIVVRTGALPIPILFISQNYLVFGGSGCGLSITLELGLLNFDVEVLSFGAGLLSEPGCEFFPETMMIDLCPDVVDCATMTSVADRLGLAAPSGENSRP